MIINILNVSSGYILRYFFQIFSFLIVTNILGTTLFGQFTAAISVAAILSSIAGWGGYPLIMKDITNNIEAKTTYTSSLFISFILSIFLIIIGLIINFIWFKEINYLSFLFLLISEVFISTTLVNASSLFIAHSMLSKSTLIQILSGISKTIAAGIMYFFPIYNIHNPKILDYWCMLILLSNIIIFVIINYIVIKKFGMFVLNKITIISNFKNGGWFALLVFSESLYVNFDKIILAFLIGFSDLGKYSSAFRFIYIAYLPLNSILTISYKKFFELANKDITETRKHAFSVQKITIKYSLFAFLSLVIFSFFLEFILGENYAGTNLILRYMSIVLIFQALYAPFNDYLVSLKKEKYVTIIKISSIILNILFNLILTPKLGVNGAIISYILGQIFLCTMIFYTPNSKNEVIYHGKKKKT